MIRKHMKDKDVYFKYHSLVDQLSEPLKKYQITYFAHKIIYDNGGVLYFGNAPKIHESYYRDDWRSTSPTERKMELLKPGYYFYHYLSDLHRDAVDYAKANNVWNIFVIIKKFDDRCELFYFGSDPNNLMINNFYINNIQFLENFILAYKSEMLKVIKPCKKEIYLKVTNAQDHLLDTAISEMGSSIKDRNNYPKKLIIELNDRNIRLTYKELQCIDHLLNGHTSKETAKILKISPRTAETHFNHIKKKFMAKSKKELKKLLIQAKLFLYSNIAA